MRRNRHDRLANAMTDLRFAACVRLLALLPCVACATGDGMFYTAEGRHLRDTERAPFRVAVTPVAVRDAVMPSMQGEGESLPLAVSLDELQQLLVADLRALNAATQVFAVAGADATAAVRAAEGRADLVLRPRLTQCKLQHVGTSGNWLLSSVLWITTWVGGLAIDDSEYEARLQIEWDVINPYTEQRIATLSTVSGQADLTYLDRHSLLSLRTLQTVVLPPFLTFDSETGSSAALTERATSRIAAGLTSYLKGELGGDERDLIGRCRIENPRNGATVGTELRLEGTITAARLINKVSVWLNGSEQPVATLTDADLRPDRQAIGSLFEVRLPNAAIGLRPGRNEVVIEFEVDRRLTSRTLEVFNGGER